MQPILLMIFLQADPLPAPGLMEMFMRSGVMAKVVLAVLVLFSLVSWSIMIGKYFHLRRARHQSNKFLQAFRTSERFSEVNSLSQRLTASPLAGIFRAGYAEILSQVDSPPPPVQGQEVRHRIRSLRQLERSLRRAIGVETRVLARGTAALATTAAATPFIGLFGTVWGIMVAFQDIGLTGSTSIVAVAPGIAEALINTAAGLGAAIPALVGYNYFANKIRRTRGEMDDFTLEFLNLAERELT
jgi:biopolymer transport protein TolQ